MNLVPTDRKTTPSRGRPGYTREDILRAAVRSFSENGYHYTSMGHIANELGISKAALYYHISSKEEILELTVNQALDMLDRAITLAEKTPGTPLDRLHALVSASINVLTTRPGSVSLLLRLRGISDVEVAALQRRRELDHRVAPLFAATVDAGQIRNDLDYSLIIRLVFGTINSVASWYEPNRALSSKEIAKTINTLVFDGLGI